MKGDVMLKKIALFVLLAFVISAQAQDDIGTGTFSLGGGLAATTTITHGDDDLTSRYSAFPECYFFISKYVALGGTVQLQYMSHGNFDQFAYGFGPGVKVFFHPSRKFKINVGTQYTYYSDDDDYSRWSLAVFAGADIFIAKNVALEPFVHIERSQPDSKYWNYPWQVNISEGLRIAVFIF